MKKKSSIIRGDLVNLTKEAATKYNMSQKDTFVFVDGFKGEESGKSLSVAVGLPGSEDYFIVDQEEFVKAKVQDFETKMLTVMIDIASGIKKINSNLDEQNLAKWQEGECNHDGEDGEIDAIMNLKAKKSDFRH